MIQFSGNFKGKTYFEQILGLGPAWSKLRWALPWPESRIRPWVLCSFGRRRRWRYKRCCSNKTVRHLKFLSWSRSHKRKVVPVLGRPIRNTGLFNFIWNRDWTCQQLRRVHSMWNKSEAQSPEAWNREQTCQQLGFVHSKTNGFRIKVFLVRSNPSKRTV